MGVVPSPHPAVRDAGSNARYVDVAVLKVCELFAVSRGNRQRKNLAVGEDGAGTSS